MSCQSEPSRRTWIAGWAFGLLIALSGCASGSRPSSAPSPAAATEADPAEPPRPDAASACAKVPLPANDNRCVYPVCDQGRWQLEPVGPSVLCELAPDFAERQAVSERAFRGDPGVCQQGECVPRLLCVERCGAALGEQFGPAFAAEIRSCREQSPSNTPSSCAQEVKAQRRGAVMRFGQATLMCFESCGFPRPEATRTFPDAPPDPSALE